MFYFVFGKKDLRSWQISNQCLWWFISLRKVGTYSVFCGGQTVTWIVNQRNTGWRVTCSGDFIAQVPITHYDEPLWSLATILSLSFPKRYLTTFTLLIVATEEKAIQIIKDLQRLCAMGGFHLTKVISKSKKVLSVVPSADRSKQSRSIKTG